MTKILRDAANAKIAKAVAEKRLDEIRAQIRDQDMSASFHSRELRLVLYISSTGTLGAAASKIATLKERLDLFLRHFSEIRELQDKIIKADAAITRGNLSEKLQELRTRRGNKRKELKELETEILRVIAVQKWQSKKKQKGIKQ
ncbi:MAG: hypothetical protein LBO72_07330 [Helicobacteraceae bacterium]|jgi:hypothetical protein|nr:hypothetical protein [Helicobacteraceae bacterium]